MAKPAEFSGTATTTQQSSDVNFTTVEALINDGAFPIIFGLDADTTSTQRRTLNAGEKYSGLHTSFGCRTLFYKAVGGSSAFRVWGNK